MSSLMFIFTFFNSPILHHNAVWNFVAPLPKCSLLPHWRIPLIRHGGPEGLEFARSEGVTSFIENSKNSIKEKAVAVADMDIVLRQAELEGTLNAERAAAASATGQSGFFVFHFVISWDSFVAACVRSFVRSVRLFHSFVRSFVRSFRSLRSVRSVQ